MADAKATKLADALAEESADLSTTTMPIVAAVRSAARPVRGVVVVLATTADTSVLYLAMMVATVAATVGAAAAAATAAAARAAVGLSGTWRVAVSAA
jgi:hypothetical protein